MGDEISALRAKYQVPTDQRRQLVGRTDPGTSAIAARKVRGKIAESEQMILGVLAHQGQPITSCQIAERLAWKICRKLPRDYGWWRLEVSRRMRGLCDRGDVVEHPSIRCPVAGSIMATWSRRPKAFRQHWTDRD